MNEIEKRADDLQEQIMVEPNLFLTTVENLDKWKARGRYNRTKALRGLRGMVDRAAKSIYADPSYTPVHSAWHREFPVAVREAATAAMLYWYEN